VEFLYVGILRLVCPLAILRWPLPGILFAAYLDALDWQLLNIQTDEDYEFYQVWDKVLDTYYLAIAAYTSLRWRDIVAKRAALVLFSWRFVGVLIFLTTGFRGALIFFPNVFEGFFIFYLAFTVLSGSNLLMRSRLDLYIVGAALFLPQLGREFFMHALDANPWEVQVVPGFPMDDRQKLWLGAYFVLPLLAMAWSVLRARRQTRLQTRL
jgi:hypothetical protein